MGKQIGDASFSLKKSLYECSNEEKLYSQYNIQKSSLFDIGNVYPFLDESNDLEDSTILEECVCNDSIDNCTIDDNTHLVEVNCKLLSKIIALSDQIKFMSEESMTHYDDFESTISLIEKKICSLTETNHLLEDRHKDALNKYDESQCEFKAVLNKSDESQFELKSVLNKYEECQKDLKVALKKLDGLSISNLSVDEFVPSKEIEFKIETLVDTNLVVVANKFPSLMILK